MRPPFEAVWISKGEFFTGTDSKIILIPPSKNEDQLMSTLEELDSRW